MSKKIFKFTTLAFATSFLAACGGGGSSSGISQSLSGVAVDFYLAGATVKLDDCNNVEILNATDANGKFNFNLPAGCTESALTITNGTDTVTGKEFTGTLRTKKIIFNNSSIVASPLTTLEALFAPEDFSLILENLGFNKNEDVTAFDPVEKGSAEQLATIFFIQQLLTQIEDAIESADPSLDANALATQALGNVLKTQKLSSTDGKIDLSLLFDPLLLDALINEAQKTAPGINAALISNNIGSLAQVLASIDLSTLGNGNALVALLKDDKQKAILDKIKDSIPEAKVYEDYLKLEGFSIGGTSYSATALNTSLTAPISTPKLDDLLVGIKAFGSEQNTSIDVAAGLKIATDSKILTLKVDKVNLQFNATGELTVATIPSDVTITVKSDAGNIGNIEVKPTSDLNVLSNGKIALNAQILSQLSASFANQINQLKLTGDNVTVTAVIDTEDATVAVDGNNGKPTDLATYNIDGLKAPGLNAKFKVTQ
jgi:hypothetical protein